LPGGLSIISNLGDKKRRAGTLSDKKKEISLGGGKGKLVYGESRAGPTNNIQFRGSK